MASSGLALAIGDDPARRGLCPLPDEDLSRLGVLLQARRHVDGVPAHHQLAACGRLAAGNDLAGVDADPEPHLGVVAIEHTLGERSERIADGQRGANRALGVVLVRLRDPENGEHRVAGELLGGAAVALDLRVDQVEELALELAHILGIESLAECRRAGEVGEEDGHDAALLPVLDGLRLLCERRPAGRAERRGDGLVGPA